MKLYYREPRLRKVLMPVQWGAVPDPVFQPGGPTASSLCSFSTTRVGGYWIFIRLKQMPQLRSYFVSEEILKCGSYGNKTGQVWVPEGSTAFKYLPSTRLYAALQSNISDCDETLKYWEPTHYLIYGKGFQAWEYSPAYL